MKFYNRGIIITGIVAFVVVVTFPFWYDRGKALSRPDIRLDTRAIQKLEDKRCVEATEFMRSNHMKLLSTWRDSAVREGRRSYTSTDGRVSAISISGNCLRCHENKAQFCDRCHNYIGVKPACWNCHIASEEGT